MAKLPDVEVGLLLSLTSSLLAEETFDLTCSRLNDQMAELKQSGIFEVIAETPKMQRPVSGCDWKAEAPKNAAAGERGWPDAFLNCRNTSAIENHRPPLPQESSFVTNIFDSQETSLKLVVSEH